MKKRKKKVKKNTDECVKTADEHILKCCEPGCSATLSIIIKTDPPGFLPNKEIEQKAHELNWTGSIIHKEETFCPLHKKNK